MDLTVDEFIECLFSKEAQEQPSDSVKAENLEMKLPEWFDEKLFNKGRRFYWNNSFMLTGAMGVGLMAIFSVPSVLRVLVGTRRSNSSYTAYRRYWSTYLHVISWFWYELKPGSVSWRSLQTVRERHVRSGNAATLKGHGIISQRNVALTQFAFLGYTVLRPDTLNVHQSKPDEWEAYNHFWRTIGYMLGLEDRYNVCRKNIDESREVFKIISDRVFTPSLTNVPEYFEHMVRVTADGLWCMNFTSEPTSILFVTKYTAGVPGYIVNETERIEFQNQIKKRLNGKSLDTGVPSTEFIQKSAIEEGAEQPTLHYYHDYDLLYSTPAYKKLTSSGKFTLSVLGIIRSMNEYAITRWFINMMFVWGVLIALYVPYVAMIRFGIRNAYVNMFGEDPTDDTIPLRNAEYQKSPSK